MDNDMITEFKVGKTYEMRWATDSTLRTPVTVEARTAKFVVIPDVNGVLRRVGVKVRDGVETCLPLGNYSMAPVLRADRVA